MNTQQAEILKKQASKLVAAIQSHCAHLYAIDEDAYHKDEERIKRIFAAAQRRRDRRTLAYLRTQPQYREHQGLPELAQP